jgi:hypothetical protein
MATRLISLAQGESRQKRGVQDLSREELMDKVSRMKEQVRSRRNETAAKNEQLAQKTCDTPQVSQPAPSEQLFKHPHVSRYVLLAMDTTCS